MNNDNFRNISKLITGGAWKVPDRGSNSMDVLQKLLSIYSNIAIIAFTLISIGKLIQDFKNGGSSPSHNGRR